ncbi:hypothetical protein PV367_33805 [Streptomyces europaeiscabiei]|uniref:Secreted protein n=1 Tax=Streptomyces europaeiscabiei TaxID=146819 RepID=A0AAJ2PWF7_9ACTN|nr:hypothetical protein [Streptomyces europaeiscabiei]MDX3134652.1 hypothetical protein [Streptomyces europaeiscabiei]
MTAAVAVALGLPLAASAGPLVDVRTSERAPTSERALTSERVLTSDLDRAGDRAGEVAGLGSGADGRADGRTDGAGEVAEKSSGHVDPKAGGSDGRTAGGDDASGGDDAADDAARSSRPPLGLGLATAARCGPELTSPDGIEAQTCVLTQGEQTWARTYYRNATGRELSSVLSMMAPGERTVRMQCAVGAHDEPGVCETPRGRTRGAMGAYTAVAEFAAPDGGGPLLLRSGSNSGRS